jgi:hypothetical protein
MSDRPGPRRWGRFPPPPPDGWRRRDHRAASEQAHDVQALPWNLDREIDLLALQNKRLHELIDGLRAGDALARADNLAALKSSASLLAIRAADADARWGSAEGERGS